MPGLTSLPPELLLEITGHLPFDARVKLSATSTQFRDLISPIIFGEMRVANFRGAEDSMVEAFQKNGKFVQVLHVSCDLGIDATDTLKCSCSCLPPVTDAVIFRRPVLFLILGRDLPKLEKLVINFRPVEYYCEICRNETSEDHELENQTLGWEFPGLRDDFGWSDAVWLLLLAVSNNKKIRELVLRNLPPRPFGVYKLAKWQELLGRLDSLDVELCPGVTSKGCRAVHESTHALFLTEIREHFFQHLNSATRVRFVAAEPYPLQFSDEHPPFDLVLTSPCHLARLVRLEMHKVFIDVTYVDALSSMSTHLKSLRLLDCYCDIDGQYTGVYHPKTISWFDFLSVVDECLPLLTDLVVSNGRAYLTGLHVPWMQHHVILPEEIYGPVEDDIPSVNGHGKGRPDHMVYGCLTEAYGVINLVNPNNQARELASYDRLMIVVRDRAKIERQEEEARKRVF